MLDANFKPNADDITWLISAASFCPIERAHKSDSMGRVNVEHLEPIGNRSDLPAHLSLKNLGTMKYIAQISEDDYVHAMLVHNFMLTTGAESHLLYDDDDRTTPERVWYVTADKIPDSLNSPDNHGVGDYFYEQAS